MISKPFKRAFEDFCFYKLLCDDGVKIAFQDNFNNSKVAFNNETIKGASLFGVDSVPSLWREIFQKLKEGHSVEFIAPTGAGKTTLYKIVALNFPGCCLIVVPTLSLARTQIEELRRLDIRAALWGHDKFTFKDLPKFIYITPEAIRYGWGHNSFKLLQLHKEAFSLLVFDEISLVYTEKHFRPAFNALYMLRLFFNGLPCFLCSAPVRSAVLRDIEKSLGFEDSSNLLRYKQGAAFRKNSTLSFYRYSNKKELREEGLLPFISCHERRSGIVFVRTIKEVSTVARFLANRLNNKVKIFQYHSKITPSSLGLAHSKKAEDDLKAMILASFMNTKESILVCTSACAYGVNKRDLAWVAFYGLPFSLNSFVQMAGRAGREKGSLAFVWCGYSLRDEEAFRAKSATEYRNTRRAFYRKQYEELLEVVHSANCRVVSIENAVSLNSAEPKPCGFCDVCRLKHPSKSIYQLLKKLRTRLSIETRTPEPLIFSQETLKNIAKQRPQSREELLTIKGIGPVKVEKYGEQILEITHKNAL